MQVCSAGSRLIVQESVADRMVKKIKERMTHLRLGDSLDKVNYRKLGFIQTFSQGEANYSFGNLKEGSVITSA